MSEVAADNELIWRLGHSEIGHPSFSDPTLGRWLLRLFAFTYLRFSTVPVSPSSR